MFTSISKIFVMGRSGCGKSYLGRRIQSAYPRKLIFDTVEEYTEADGEILRGFNHFCERLLEIERSGETSYTLIYQFDAESQKGNEEFNEVLRICFYKGNFLIVIEEVQDFAPVHFLPHWLRQCMLKGRHRNLAMLFTSQRPGEVHKTVFSQCTHTYCGTIIDGNDLRYLKPIFGPSTEKLPTLPDRKFLYFGRDGVKEVDNNF